MAGRLPGRSARAWANLRARQVVQGGSSITQQVAKILIVGQERSLARKVREALLAFRIEKRLRKDQILGIYLNHVYLGHGAYGLASAATAYFGKSVAELTVAEAAMLAALPKAPGNITPLRDLTAPQPPALRARPDAGVGVQSPQPSRAAPATAHAGSPNPRHDQCGRP